MISSKCVIIADDKLQEKNPFIALDFLSPIDHDDLAHAKFKACEVPQ